MGRREDVEGMRGGLCERAHSCARVCLCMRACAPPSCALPRAGVQVRAREKLSCNRDPVGASAPSPRGVGADGSPCRAAHRCRRAAHRCRRAACACRRAACARARACQHDLEPVDCLPQAVDLGVLACQVGRSRLGRAQQPLLLPRAKSGVATRFAPRRVCLFVCLWLAPARRSSYRARERPPCGRTRKAAHAACTEYNMTQQDATGCDRMHRVATESQHVAGEQTPPDAASTRVGRAHISGSRPPPARHHTHTNATTLGLHA
jgi:hypothetical protein